MTVACPYCGKVLTEDEATSASVFCHRLQAMRDLEDRPNPRRRGDTWYEHSVGARLTADDDRMATWSEQISPRYIRASREGRSRFVSVVGPAVTGKSVWILAVGCHAELHWADGAPQDPALGISIFSADAPSKDSRREAIEKLPLGKLPVRSTVREIPTLPVSFSHLRDESDGLCFVLKDVAGEAARVLDFHELVTRVETRHLFRAEWVILTLDASDDSRLLVSVREVKHILERYAAERDQRWLQKGKRRWPFAKPQPRPGVVVTLTRVDNRHMVPDDPLLRAVNRPPNRFPIALSDLGEYLRQMECVSQEVKSLIRRTSGNLLAGIKRQFDPERTFFSAISSLGTQPCPVNGGEGDGEGREEHMYEAQCVAEPAFIRVLDPVLWILKSEKVIADL